MRRTPQRNHLAEPLVHGLRIHCLRVRSLGKLFLIGWFVGSLFSICRADEFDSDVAPILIRRCVECHQLPTPSGGLDLASEAGLTRGGDSGPAIDRAMLEKSWLLERIVAGEMPPVSQGKSQQLPESETAVIARWIKSGAPWPAGRKLDLFEKTTRTRAGRDWWSLQAVVRPPVPPRDSRLESPTLHPVDAFVRQRLDEHGLSPAPKADRPTLIRRLYFDLLGLPPTLQQVESFVKDDRPDAWERLIEELLQSPQYGERWGRYWLDIVRYADTSGYERDQEKPFAWKYRDWVIAAFNRDMPYDQFITYQLAGDQIHDASIESVIATGFMRLGTWNDEPNEPLDYQYERLEDLVHTTSSAFLGLTVKCARCHPHKFDPITQEDYYRMAACFWPGSIGPRDSKLLGGPSREELGYSEVLGWSDITESPTPLHMLKNGERHHPLQPVAAAGLSFVPELQASFSRADAVSLESKAARGTGYRLALARWITSPSNPLTYRVIVNRLWQHHFGHALVRTPNNFGFLADPPTHPRLLDWLASEFVRSGQSLKAMHRILLTSETYQQSSNHPDHDQVATIDAGNRLWWRAERRRLDVEALRDSMLMVSGDLDLRGGGPGFTPSLSTEALDGLSRKSAAWNASPAVEQLRRSVYMRVQRGLVMPMFTTFDFCDTTQTCGQRDVSIVPPQALALMNNEFVHQRSDAIAGKVIQATHDRDGQVEMAWSMALGRLPTANERQLAREHVEQLLSAYPQLLHAQAVQPSEIAIDEAKIEASLVMSLTADQITLAPGGQAVVRVRDQTSRNHDAEQADPNAQPLWRAEAIGDYPALMFNGNGKFLHLSGQPLEKPYLTIVAVVSDSAVSGDGALGHREIISNWHAPDNIGTSIFLGLTAERQIRFSDALTDAGSIPAGGQPVLITAMNGPDEASVFCNGKRLASLPGGLPNRRLVSPWVLGQQGNIGGEYWTGSIGCIRIYNRPLTQAERESVERGLAERYAISLEPKIHSTPYPKTPERLALASLCHVLLNSNEFIYVD